MDSNVGMGVVPCRKGCRCDDCCIEQLERDAGNVEITKQLNRDLHAQNAKLQARLDAVQTTRDAVWEHASGCGECCGKEADLMDESREPDCAECEVLIKILLDLDKALKGEE